MACGDRHAGGCGPTAQPAVHPFPSSIFQPLAVDGDGEGRMQAAVEIVDWAPGTPQQTRPKLRLVSKTLTAGELIAERVAAECRALENAENLSLAELKQHMAGWLVVPGVDERTLNGRR